MIRKLRKYKPVSAQSYDSLFVAATLDQEMANKANSADEKDVRLISTVR